ncbi:UPF0115 protein YfcN [Candidatus Erwinia haradaeae]|uniref:Ribosome rescue factor SmrB n=1 Tax=Candidatus Erwinia haradaeae TaxID=1922217 RepID=A0A451DCB6_9GAMM|nr:endonuclease SmrB [Candidatus Erwinia haradaeae]VFP83981.1 UPF0115 protein YfcN [Candidatus Erwinia haradaeae]
MNKKQQSGSVEDQKISFRRLMSNTRQLVQDTITHTPLRKNCTRKTLKRLILEQSDESHYFSDTFQPILSNEGALCYARSDVHRYELKKLYSGYYTPEIFLDLHGLTQIEAKRELGALIATCRREHLYCSGIMHGYGKHVLKNQTPLWLAQHPLVMAFHQAPKQFGGDAALLVLIEVAGRRYD